MGHRSQTRILRASHAPDPGSHAQHPASHAQLGQDGVVPRPPRRVGRCQARHVTVPAGREPLAAPGALWESGGRADLAPAPLGASGLVRPRGSLSAAEGGSGVGKGALGRVEAKGLRVGVPAAGALAGGRSPQRGAGREETARASWGTTRC